jgi:hypothetical protein
MVMTPSREARLAAGFTLEAIAKRIRRSARYIGDCERRQDFPLCLATRLARHYGCSLNAFLAIRPGGGTVQRPRAGRRADRPARTSKERTR